MEDPLRAESPEAYRRLRAGTTVPLAAGEQYGSKWEFRTLIDEDLVDFVRPDLGIVGGITEARRSRDGRRGTSSAPPPTTPSAR